MLISVLQAAHKRHGSLINLFKILHNDEFYAVNILKNSKNWTRNVNLVKIGKKTTNTRVFTQLTS